MLPPLPPLIFFLTLDACLSWNKVMKLTFKCIYKHLIRLFYTMHIVWSYTQGQFCEAISDSGMDSTTSRHWTYYVQVRFILISVICIIIIEVNNPSIFGRYTFVQDYSTFWSALSSVVLIERSKWKHFIFHCYYI